MTDKSFVQLDQIKEAARQLGINDDPGRSKERVGKPVVHKLAPDAEKAE